MKTYNYLLTTSVIWASFDGGTVQAENPKEALKLAEIELRKDLDRVNKVLAANPDTKNVSIDMNMDEIEVTEVIENFSHVMSFNFTVTSESEVNPTKVEIQSGLKRAVKMMENRTDNELEQRCDIVDTFKIS